MEGGQWKNAIFPSLFALLKHPSAGLILFDTGYSGRFFQETRSFPFRFYRIITPVYFKEEESAVSQLQQQEITPEAVNFIIVSHFHADHIGGLKDFPQAKFFCFQSAYEAVKLQRGIAAVKAGFLPGLLPLDFEERAIFVEKQAPTALPPEYAPFEWGFDILGDGSILAVELPGHVIGQLGIFFTDRDNQTYFLIADACWLSRAYQELVTPHTLANLIFANRQAYVDTLHKIHKLYQLNPGIKIIPTHCQDTWKSLQILNKFPQ